MNILLRIVLLLVIVGVLALGALRIYFGPGVHYENLTTAPLVTETGLEQVLAHHEPIGNVAVSASRQGVLHGPSRGPAAGPPPARVARWQGRGVPGGRHPGRRAREPRSGS
jgi:hypothetical protein